jgi:hypothetical protein
MINFFERRTAEHIHRVRRCLEVLAASSIHGRELLERADRHDASKFGSEERIPYIWLTEFHRCRTMGEPFQYPEKMEEQVRAAIKHHVTTNRHHPEFHADPDDMTDVDLMEMVCDWTAMSQEFQQDGGSAKAWADRTIGHRVHWNASSQQIIYQTISQLDHHFGASNAPPMIYKTRWPTS